jgi:beta-glucosidase
MKTNSNISNSRNINRNRIRDKETGRQTKIDCSSVEQETPLMKNIIKHLPGTPEEFFCGGLEDSFVAHARPGHPERPMDEFELMRVYKRFRKYLNHVAKLQAGNRRVTRLRTGAPWHLIETQPGVYDWRWMDKFVNHANKLSIDLIVDVVHYATPLWLEKSFLDPLYPEHVASFAAALATRYKGKVNLYTPLNEPGVNAQMCGEAGAWAPYLTGGAGYVQVMIQLALGIQQTVQAIRAVDPDAVMFAVEAMGYYAPLSPAAVPVAKAKLHRDLVCWDLVHGTVDESHACFGWLTEMGTSLETLAALRSNAVKMDVLGVNFYPWSSKTVDVVDGKVVDGWGKWDGHLLANLLQDCHEYTQAPMWVTETSAHGAGAGSKTGAVLDHWPELRIEWLDGTMEACAQVRKEGLPLLGYTQFPLFSMVDWLYRDGTGSVEDYLINLGMYDVKLVGEDDIKIIKTATVDRFLYHLSMFETQAA